MRIDHVKLNHDGRIVIPVALRHDVGFKPGATLVLESDGDSLLVRSYDAVLDGVQDYFQQHNSGSGSVVDELIAERRSEAAREESAHSADTGSTSA